jgi:hypothetical protein
MKTYINLEKGVAHDFISGEGYSPFEVIKALGEFPDNASAAKAVEKFVMKNLGSIDLTDSIHESPSRSKKETAKVVTAIDIPEGFVDIGDGHFFAKQARAYMRNRGYSYEILKKYHIMVGTKGDYARRVIIPFIENNEIVWFQGRTWNKANSLKYLNPTDVSKSVLVYNIDAIKRVAIITEGPLDAMMIGGQAVMGAVASDWQVDKILAKKPKKIILVPDNDPPKIIKGEKFSPGYSGALKSVEKVVKMGYNIGDISIAFLEGGKDINDIGKVKAQECIINAKPINITTLLKFKEYGAESKYLEKIV